MSTDTPLTTNLTNTELRSRVRNLPESRKLLNLTVNITNNLFCLIELDTIKETDAHQKVDEDDPFYKKEEDEEGGQDEEAENQEQQETE